MSRYQKLFQDLSFLKQGCFVPFVILGDPCMETSIKIIEVLIENGADAIELGIPFSDPLADGPIIQKANIRALSQKNTFLQSFAILKKIRKKYLNIPIGILIYANLIHNQGINTFYLQCHNADIDSVLIADVPIEESKKFYEAANKYNIDTIFVCPPEANNSLLHKIAKYAKGYIYLLSYPGVTGITKKFFVPKINLIEKIKTYTSIPVLQGFGISNTIQIKNILKLGIEGVICGSIIISIIEKYLLEERKMLKEIKILTSNLKKST